MSDIKKEDFQDVMQNAPRGAFNLSEEMYSKLKAILLIIFFLAEKIFEILFMPNKSIRERGFRTAADSQYNEFHLQIFGFFCLFLVFLGIVLLIEAKSTNHRPLYSVLLFAISGIFQIIFSIITIAILGMAGLIGKTFEIIFSIIKSIKNTISNAINWGLSLVGIASK